MGSIDLPLPRESVHDDGGWALSSGDNEARTKSRGACVRERRGRTGTVRPVGEACRRVRTHRCARCTGRVRPVPLRIARWFGLAAHHTSITDIPHDPGAAGRDGVVGDRGRASDCRVGRQRRAASLRRQHSHAHLLRHGGGGPRRRWRTPNACRNREPRVRPSSTGRSPTPSSPKQPPRRASCRRSQGFIVAVPGHARPGTGSSPSPPVLPVTPLGAVAANVT